MNFSDIVNYQFGEKNPSFYTKTKNFRILINVAFRYIKFGIKLKCIYTNLKHEFGCINIYININYVGACGRTTNITKIT